MAEALDSINPTYLDVIRRTDPEGKIATIIELMNETNEILSDEVAIECNNGKSHISTVRTGLPSATWRKLNYGVQPSKSETKQVTDATGMLETYSEIDKDLADLNKNDKAWRLSEELAFLETMNQDMAETLFYGDTDKNPERFLGLTPRYDAIDGDKTKIGYNIVNADSSASGNCTSIWLLVWGRSTVHGIYPNGSKAGFQRNYKGQVTLNDGDGGQYEGYRTHYKWDKGFTVRDWRYVVRIANIDISRLNAEAENIDLFDVMTDAYYKVPSINRGRAVFYCTNEILSMLHKQAKNQATQLKIDEVAGKPVATHLGIPIRRCDQILMTESVVS